MQQCGWVIFNSLSSSGLGWSTDNSGHFLEVIDSLNLSEIPNRAVHPRAPF